MRAMLPSGVTQVQRHQHAEIRLGIAAEVRRLLEGQRLRSEFLHERGHALLGLSGITAAGQCGQGLHRGVRRGVECLLHCVILFRAVSQGTDHPAWLPEHDLGKELRAPGCRAIGADRADCVIGRDRGGGLPQDALSPLHINSQEGIHVWPDGGWHGGCCGCGELLGPNGINGAQRREGAEDQTRGLRDGHGHRLFGPGTMYPGKDVGIHQDVRSHDRPQTVAAPG